MFTTARKSKLITNISLEHDMVGVQDKLVSKERSEDFLTGRVLALCLETFFFGFALAYFSSFNDSITTLQYTQAITYKVVFGFCLALIPLGASIGVIISYFTMNKFSRKTYLVILDVLNLCVTGFLQIPNIEVLFIFRFAQGVLVGNYMTLIPEYISEICPKEVASYYSVFPQISVVMGVLVAYTLGVIYTVSGLDYTIFWRLQMAFPFVPTIVQLGFIAFSYIPQSPNSLILKNRREEARQILALFSQERFIDGIVEEKQNHIFHSKELYEQESKQVSTRARFIGLELSIFQGFCGIASMVTQAGHVISYFDTEVGRYTPIVITIAQLVGTFISIPLIHRYEWKYITIVGGFILATCNSLLAILFVEYYENKWQLTMVLAMVVIILQMFTFGLTFGSSIWPYISFILPTDTIQGALVINWICSGLTILCLSICDDFITPPFPMFFLYSGITLGLSILNIFFMVPIRGLTFTKVQQKLS